MLKKILRAILLLFLALLMSVSLVSPVLPNATSYSYSLNSPWQCIGICLDLGTINYKFNLTHASMGNLSFTIPSVSGLSLTSNSSAVKYLVGNYQIVFAKIINSYNLNVTLSGVVPSPTIIVLPLLSNEQRTVMNSSVIFGRFGFDWSNTNGQFNNVTNTVSWLVNGQFVIDPITFVTGASGFKDPMNNGDTLGTSTVSVHTADEEAILVVSSAGGLSYTLNDPSKCNNRINTNSLTKMASSIGSTGVGTTDIWRGEVQDVGAGASDAPCLTLNGGGGVGVEIFLAVAVYRGAGNPTTSINAVSSTGTGAVESLSWTSSTANSFMIMGCGNNGLNLLPISDTATVDQSASDADTINEGLGHQLSVGGAITDKFKGLARTTVWACAGYELPLGDSTSTSVSCSPSSITVGSSTTCTATVTDTASPVITPITGKVSWCTLVNFLTPNACGDTPHPGTGSFSPSSSEFVPGGTCTLSGAGNPASCSVTYTAGSSAGSVVIDGLYNGDSKHAGSAGSTTVTVTTVQKSFGEII